MKRRNYETTLNLRRRRRKQAWFTLNRKAKATREKREKGVSNLQNNLLKMSHVCVCVYVRHLESVIGNGTLVTICMSREHVFSGRINQGSSCSGGE